MASRAPLQWRLIILAAVECGRRLEISTMVGGVIPFFRQLFDSDFVPRAQCFNLDPITTWLHVTSDLVIALAYFSIPVALLYFIARRRDLAFDWMFALFAGFIVLCGLTHVFDVLAVWNPVYRLDGLIKAATALFSIGTAAALWPLIPRALALPSPAHLREANAALQTEVGRREAAQAALAASHQELERRVTERTAELARTNAALSREVQDRTRAQAELTEHRERLEEIVNERTRALEASHERLRSAERMAAIGTLSAGLGHDMGNLLLPVRVRLDSLAPKLTDPESRLDLDVIRRCAEHLQRLSNGLRLFALDPSDAHASRGSVDVADWWANVAPFLRNALPPDSTLAAEIPPGLPHVRLATHLLTQAVFNLVQNAGDAVRRTGRPASVTVAARVVGSDIELTVTDDGPGMSDAIRARCMEPFFTTKGRDLSTGLGLALVHGVVRSVGGTVRIRTAPGAGAAFTLVLPAEPPQAAAAAPPDQPTVGLRLSDPRRRGFVASLLGHLGYAAARLDSPEPPAASPAIIIGDAAGGAADLLAVHRRYPNAKLIYLGEASPEVEAAAAVVLPASATLSQIRAAMTQAIADGVRAP